MDTNYNATTIVVTEKSTISNERKFDIHRALFFSNILVYINKVWRSPVSSNSFAALLLRGTTISTRLIVLFIIASFATPAEFGRVAFAIAIAEIAKVIADFGIDTLSIREFAIMQVGKRQQIFACTVAITKFICGIIIYLLCLLFFLLMKGEIKLDIEAIAGLLAVTSLWSNLFINYFQAQLKTTKIVLPVFLNGMTTIIVAIILFLVKPNVLLLIAILPISEAVNIYILSRFFFTEVRFDIEGLQLSKILTLLKRSVPIATTTICVVFYTRLDVVALSHYFDTATVGYYGIAYRMTEPVQFIAGAFSVSIYSHIATSLASNCNDLRNSVKRFLLGTLVFGILSSLVLIMFAPIIIKQLFPNYIPAIPVLQLLALALIFRTLNNSLTAIIQAYGHFTKITAVAMWNLILISMILWVCVPRLGAVGAAIALIIGEIVNTIIQLYIAKRIVYGTYT